MQDGINNRNPNEHARAEELYAALHTFAVQSRPGTPLLSENALARKYRMSRMTARKALKRLTAEGLIERRHGVGSFVKGKRVVTLLLPCPDFFTDAFAPYNDEYLLFLQGIMQATMELGVSLEMIAVSPSNNPNYLDYSQLSEIHAGSLVICTSWFYNLYEFLIGKGAQVAILGAQNEHYGYRHFHRDFYTCNCDYRQALCQVLDYLFNHGKRRILLAGWYLQERMHPVHDTYVDWCRKHHVPELIGNLPHYNLAGNDDFQKMINLQYRTEHFDALILHRTELRNVSGSVQQLFGLPPDCPVFGIGYCDETLPGLKSFPYFRSDSVKLAYEAVKLLLKGAQRGTVLTFPCEFRNLPADWEESLKENDSESSPSIFSNQQQTKEKENGKTQMVYSH